jgi:hypothetical protein
MLSLRHSVRVGFAVGLFALPLFALIDNDGDGISDLWPIRYPNSGGPNEDPNDDGVSNRDEAIAGTDPTTTTDRFAATPQADAAGNLVLRWPGVTGKHYRIESTTDLRTWTRQPDEFIGIGTELSTIVRPAGTAGPVLQFWRVVVFDYDTDGDSLNDWEEALFGTDSNNPDTDGDGVSDGAQQKAFGSPTYDGSADSDGDGDSDRDELLNGTDRLDPYNGHPPLLPPVPPVPAPSMNADPVWLMLRLPMGYEPLAGSLAGVAVLQQGDNRYKWYNGNITPLSAGEFRLNQHGFLAEFGSLSESYNSPYRVKLTTPSGDTRTYVQPGVAWSFYDDWYTKSMIAGVTHEMYAIALDDTGTIWYWSLLGRNGHAVYRIPYGGSIQQTDLPANDTGIYVHRSGRSIAWSGSVESANLRFYLDFLPIGIRKMPTYDIMCNANGTVCFLVCVRGNELLTWLRYPDGYEQELPTNINYNTTDEQERLDDQECIRGQNELWVPRRNDAGEIVRPIVYDRIDYLPLPLPDGWTTDHMVAPGETKAQVGYATHPTLGTSPFLAIPLNAALAVDANRDGTIKLPSEDASDATSVDKPFRFWLNDDDDSGDVDGKDIPGQPRNGPGEEGADYTTTSPSADVEGNGAIDGTRDFIDFFPVFIELKQILAALPPTGTVKYKLKQADGAVNFVYTNQTRDHAFDFQRQKLTNGFGAALSQAPEWSQTQRVTRQGVELRGDFLNLIQTSNGGVLLIEGCAPTTAPLVLAVEKDGTTIAEVKLELKIGPVEDMYRRLNLRTGGDAPSSGLSGLRQDDGLPTSMGEPSNFPDATGPDSWLVFVHGYNVSGAAARGWNSEAFKRFYWSHNKARFVGVSWFGNPYGAEEDKVADYHLAVMNAFVSAPALAAKINPLTGRKTIVGHSLGCGIVSSAIHDAGLVVNDFCMVDAAMSMEAYKSDTTADVEGMAIPPWVDGEASNTPNYPRGAWASEWHRLFENTPADQRNGVTWRGRLSGVVSVAHNFYSRTEDVLARLPGTPPDGILSILWSQPGMLSGRYAWTVQEKTKGRRMDINVLVGHVRAGSDYGGWGFNLTDPADPTDPVYYWADGSVLGGCKRAQLSSFPDPATSLGRELYKRAPLFDPGYGPETGCMRWYDPTRDLRGPSWLPDLFNEGTGSVTAGDPNKRNQLLAQAFPALTQPAGANYTPAFSAARNHNMPEELLGPAGWPAARGQEVVGGTPMARWLHSDMREVAYLYTHLLFDQIVTISGGTP